MARFNVHDKVKKRTHTLDHFMIISLFVSQIDFYLIDTRTHLMWEMNFFFFAKNFFLTQNKIFASKKHLKKLSILHRKSFSLISILRSNYAFSCQMFQRRRRTEKVFFSSLPLCWLWAKKFLLFVYYCEGDKNVRLTKKVVK